jgi:hypothetical protein
MHMMSAVCFLILQEKCVNVQLLPEEEKCAFVHEATDCLTEANTIQPHCVKYENSVAVSHILGIMGAIITIRPFQVLKWFL